MRIAAKRLRYTLEISKPVYDDRLDEFIESVKNLQTLLGEIHDCDVWREQLQAFSEKLRRRILKHFGHVAPLGRLQSGIAYLDDDRRRRRAVVFDELAAYWRQLAEKRFWERLAAIVMARPQEPRQPRPQAAAGDGQPALTPAAGGRPRECQTPGADETVDDLDQVDHGRQAERRGGGPPAAPPRLELQEALSH
jgi:hypothetical protein